MPVGYLGYVSFAGTRLRCAFPAAMLMCVALILFFSVAFAPSGPARLPTLPTVTSPSLVANDSSLVAAFMGDSYVSGSGPSTPDKRWTSLVSQQMGWVEHNYGAGGTGYWRSSAANPNYLGRVSAVIADNPDIVVVSGGQNDIEGFAYDSAPVSDAIARTYAALHAGLPNARIIAVGPSSPQGDSPQLYALDQQVQAAAQATGSEYVSLAAPAVIQPDMVVADGHVNDLGHSAIAQRVVSGLGHV